MLQSLSTTAINYKERISSKIQQQITKLCLANAIYLVKTQYSIIMSRGEEGQDFPQNIYIPILEQEVVRTCTWIKVSLHDQEKKQRNFGEPY